MPFQRLEIQPAHGSNPWKNSGRVQPTTAPKQRPGKAGPARAIAKPYPMWYRIITAGMKANDFHLNRPIHLARRDVYFERAVELLYLPIQELDTEQRLVHVDRVLSLLQTAAKHAGFAMQSPDRLDLEPYFLHFLGLMAHNVQSAHAMMQHQSHLEREEGFLCHFLNATAEECALPALHYRRRADDILQGVWHLLRLAHRSYHVLQSDTTKALPEADRTRYQKAYQSFRAEVLERFAPAAPTPA